MHHGKRPPGGVWDRIRAVRSSIYAGLPEETNAITVNKVCASGMKAIALAAQSIRAGDAETVVAGGMENMSNAPFALPDARWGYRMSMPFGKITDLVVFDGLYEIFNGYHMGFTAENIAARYGITRREQDELALISHQRARAAIASGAVADEIVPVIIPQKKGAPLVFETDERPMDTSLEKLAKLPPAFKKEAERSPPETPPGSMTGRRRSSSWRRIRQESSASSPSPGSKGMLRAA